MKNDSLDVLNNIRKKFTSYETYYQILGINPSGLTDEKVKEVYEEKSRQLDLLFLKSQQDLARKESQTEPNLELEKQILELKDIIQTTLSDAFNALKSEHSRKNYNELLGKINVPDKNLNNKSKKEAYSKENSTGVEEQGPEL